MENDDAIVGTILNRREVLATFGRWGLGAVFGGVLCTEAEAALQQRARQDVKLVASPALTEGPFFVDEKLKRSNLLVGTQRPSVVQGVPLELPLTLYRLTGGRFVPLPGATVDLWSGSSALSVNGCRPCLSDEISLVVPSCYAANGRTRALSRPKLARP